MYSYPFVGVVQPARMAGHDVYYKRIKENDQTATINNNSKARATINNKKLPLPIKAKQ
jgi:hypothetical protein